MIANYHTHTWRCHHAKDTEREYVERAIEGGIKILGFSDHTPYPFPENYTSGIRMSMDQLEDYADTVLALRDEYRKDIEIHLGLEAEYYPEYFAKLLEAAKNYPIEYFIHGQHALDNEMGAVYSGRETQDPQILKRYTAQVKAAMDTGCFTYLAHPDLIHFTGDPAVYEQEMRSLCLYAKKHNLPLEINCLGIRESRHYPNESFWKIAGEEGCSVILGADAHSAADVWQPNCVEWAEKFVQRWNLKLLQEVELRSPF